MRKMKKIVKKIQKCLKRNLEEDDISLEELNELRKRGITIIDVRSPQEFQENHIDGAISIPEYEIKKDIIDRINPEEEIIVYCSSGGRSKKAKNKLEKLGYKKVYNLYNGWMN